MAKLTCPRDMVIFKLCWAAHVYHLVKSPNLPDIFPGKTWVHEINFGVDENLGQK